MPPRPKVLVVDDNEEFCQNLKDILELNGYEVVTAYDGFSGLELVRENGFDLVLMDIKMPVMDGVETYKKMKEVSTNMPVIMVTAFAVEELIKEALQEGAYGSLGKPLDVGELLSLVAEATGKGAMLLVADDDENTCANMQDILSHRGYRVSVAYDGHMAIEKAKKNSFDVLLLDMKMPALNGLETYLAIREFRPNVVAIIITGYRQEMNKLIEGALQKNAYACLEKPVDMERLLSLLAAIKEQKKKGALNKPQ